MKISGYAAHFGQANRNGEKVSEDAFADCIEIIEKLKSTGYRVPVNYNHNQTIVVGSVEEMTTDKVGLMVTAEISDEVLDEYGLLKLVKNGTIDAFSTEGYIDEETVKIHDDNTYTANDFFVTAIAIVANPADKDAKFTQNKLSFLGAETQHFEVKDKQKKQKPLIYIL